MDDIQTRLRSLIQELRTTPKPLADIIPLLLEAADRIEYLQDVIDIVDGVDEFFRG